MREERWNQEAEESVLGAMILSSKAIDAVLDAVVAEDFYWEKHGLLFTAMATLHMENKPVDAVTLAAYLEEKGILSKVGGKAKVAEIAALVPAASNASHYARIVHEASVVRKLTQAGDKIATLATSASPLSLDEMIASAEELLSKAVLSNTGAVAMPITDGLTALVAEWRQAYTTKTAITGCLTGVGALDGALQGLWPGQLLMLAARPAVGKSTLALNIAENLADMQKHTLTLTLEMSRRELQIKGVARAGKIDGTRLSTGLIEEAEAKRLTAAIEKIQAREPYMHVNDDGHGTVPALAAEASRLHRQHGLDLIIVDYIQLMQGVGEKKSDEVASISRGLKLLARRLEVPVLAVSQMNRGIESRSEKRPTLADLRDSGALEQDADVVLFLHDPTAYNMDMAATGSVDLLVAKNRRGSTGDYSLLFAKKYSSFLNPQSVPRTGDSND